LQELDIYHDIPTEILCYVIPLYHFKSHDVTEEFVEKLKLHCIDLKIQAKHEDTLCELNEQKEILVNRLKTRIKIKLLRNIRKILQNDDEIDDEHITM